MADVWIVAEPSAGRERVAALARRLGFEVSAVSPPAAPPEDALVLLHESVDPRPFAAFAPVVYGETTPMATLSQRLVALGGEAEALLALYVHDINNPLGAARMVGELLQGDPAPEAARDLEDLLRAVDEAILVTEGLGGHLRALGGAAELARAPFDLGQAVVDALERPAFRGQVEIARPAQPVLMEGNRDVIVQAVRDMLANARRMAREASIVAVRVGADRSVQVRAEGFALPADLGERLTRPFGGLVAREQRVPVAPFGLAFASWAAEAHGGRLVVDHRDDGFDVGLLLG